MQARAYRADRALEHRGALGIRELLELAQHERLAVLDRQARYRRVQAHEPLLRENELFALARRGQLRNVVRPATLGTQSVEHGMPGAAEQPSAYRALRGVE